ncbi:MAG: pyrrolysine--tRNA(Pyl) ligase large subunit [Coriobacteriia bacterium]|nr:pyrrolysine--tRNA(Pyl) ligase large subunit [Coriobacteriia bacterium]MCL2751066.1 pyrrolysine--tRNA(Pyl) ligase large subunit [Coriobacteriia bacterium]
MQFTKNQIQRLSELGCDFDAEHSFASADARELAFKEMERRSVEKNRAALRDLRKAKDAPFVSALSESISAFLRGLGFLEVSTPIIISKSFLLRMTIEDDHALFKQVFWLDDKSCLRPMLAPNLYDISKRLLNVYEAPLGVFEIGPCFRRESQGNKHLESFTMVNFVEWGVLESQKTERLKELISLFMEHVGLSEYSLEEEDSVVYGDTIDVVVDGVEIASGAFGPHPLDSNWDYAGTWIGLGAGLERIVLMQENLDSIQKTGRSLLYLGGISLKLK